MIYNTVDSRILCMQLTKQQPHHHVLNMMCGSMDQFSGLVALDHFFPLLCLFISHLWKSSFCLSLAFQLTSLSDTCSSVSDYRKII